MVFIIIALVSPGGPLRAGDSRMFLGDDDGDGGGERRRMSAARQFFGLHISFLSESTV
jgi:hypothetical protein